MQSLHTTELRSWSPGAARQGLNKAHLRSVLEHTVACVFEIERERLNQPTRGVASVSQARQVAMYLAHVGYGLSLTAVGELFERDRTTVAHACRIVEERREAVAYDRAMDLLEAVVRQLSSGAGTEQ